MHPYLEETLPQVAREHGGQLEGCDRLLQFALDLIAPPWRGRPIRREHEGLIAAIFARSTNTYWSALELARLGFGEQSAMLNRSLFEDMVDLHWIADNPERAVERFEQHGDHSRMVLADALQKHPGFMPAEKLPDVDPQERSELDKLFGSFGHKSWTSVSLYERVNSIEHYWGEGSLREQLHFVRDIVHRDNNQLLHVSYHSVNQVIRGSSPEEGGLSLKLGPGGEYLDRALHGSWWIYSQSVGLLIDHFELPEHEALGELAPNFYRLDDDEIRTVGRNDPCPCGSGKKFKRCHGR